MYLAIVAASLLRHRARSALAIAGVAVSAAMLLDMVMLSTGMRESFREMITGMGFQFRLAPKGTLPFDTEATITGAGEIVAKLRSDPAIAEVSPVLGATIHVPRGEGAVTATALGLIPRVQGDYELLTGRDMGPANTMVANEEFLQAAAARVGDTLDVARGYDAELRTFAARAPLIVTGSVRFVYLAAGEPAVAMPIATLQRIGGTDRADRASLFMLKTAAGVDPDTLRARLEREFPRVSVLSTADALRQVDDRLSYFRQLAFILGAVSLGVGFLLVTTLVTVSVNERIGEIAVLRAIGVSRAHVVAQVVAESAGLVLPGALLGLGLGLVTARYLNAILSAFPGLPRAVDFFLFQPRAAWGALGLLVACGIVAALYPAWRAAALPIAGTLREEAVG
ncbi:MAG: ABC transporter permease [Gemmatimonadaceae bacterium]